MTLTLCIYSIYTALCIYSIYCVIHPSTDVRDGTEAFTGFLGGVLRRVFIPVHDPLVLYRDDVSVYTILYIQKITLYRFWRGAP